MKKKRDNLKKYISRIIQESHNNNMIRQTKYVDNFYYCEYNEEISKKFYKFLELALSLKVDTTIGVDNICLNINLSEYDKSNQTANIGKTVNSIYDDSFITFYITKTNFKINRNHMEICGYKDNFIYNLFKDKIIQSHEQKSSDIFHTTINDILDKVPHIGREYKIDEILND